MVRQHDLLHDLVQQLVVPTFVIGLDGRVIVWNRACERLTGMPAQDAVGSDEPWRAFYDHRRPLLAELIASGRTGEIAALYASTDSSALIYGGFHAENWCVMPLRGVELYLAVDAGPIHDAAGQVVAVVETLRDQTEWKHAEAQLRLNASVFENSTEGILIADRDKRIICVNPAFSRLTGYGAEEVRGRNPGMLKSGIHDRAFYDELWQSVNATGQWCGEIWNRRKNGEVFPESLCINAVRDADGELTNYIGMFSDITQAKQVQERLEDMANHDALTGLPNRIFLSGRLHQALAAARRSDRMLAVCFLDLDGFKPINDSHGHEVGDAMLVEVAGRLKGATRQSDTVARIGGDEFVVLLSEFQRVDEIELAVGRILRAVARPFRVGELTLSVSASIGVTIHPMDESDSDTLIRHADQAMYVAKSMGRNTWHMFDTREDSAASQVSDLLNRVRQGLQRGEFRLFYQPKVNLRRGTVEGMEALIRWQHPEQGLVPPGDFLPVVENTPLIIDLGEWVIHEALGQIMHWAAEGMPIKVSVNIAARHFQHIDFIPRLRGILAQYPDVSQSLLELEVLEGTALKDIETVRAIVVACQGMGVSFALDDFGTGYSTLTYLKRLPADTLKIDRSFVRDMLEDQEDLALVEGVIGLASVFHMGVVAEGVETLEQGVVLMRIGCDVVQGFYVARPMPAADAYHWLLSFKPDPAWAFWAGSQWDRTHLPLILAEYDHLKWVQRILESIDHPEAAPAPEELRSHHRCRFGQWFESDGRRCYGHLPEFAEIEPIHRQVHELGSQIVHLGQEGRAEEARALAGKLASLRGMIVERLAALHRVMGESGFAA